ncbi:MAG: hypothetical protein KC435_01930 [Thermomicrobiales bacterium]|nr:hypothetical protein [Thermomicrobiales bacterium]
MSHLDSTESFIEMFGTAFDRAHRRTERADMPSERVKDRVMKDIAGMKMRSETADPSAFGPDLASRLKSAANERSLTVDTTLGIPTRTPLAQASRWWAVAVTGLAIALVIVSFRMTIHPSGPLVKDDNNIAYAPLVSTPMATAIANSCTAEPLTADEVMNMVKGPERGYARLSHEPDTGEPEATYSDEPWTFSEQPRSSAISAIDLSMMVSATETDTPISETKEAADQFWNCLLYGTSYQVWGLMAPELVQGELLAYYPVFRTEADVLKVITELGPQPYSKNRNASFTTLEDVGSPPVELRSLSGDSGVWVFPEFEGQLAVVEMNTVDQGGASNIKPRYLLIQKFPNGQWIVIGVDWQVVRA